MDSESSPPELGSDRHSDVSNGTGQEDVANISVPELNVISEVPERNVQGIEVLNANVASTSSTPDLHSERRPHAPILRRLASMVQRASLSSVSEDIAVTVVEKVIQELWINPNTQVFSDEVHLTIPGGREDVERIGTSLHWAVQLEDTKMVTDILAATIIDANDTTWYGCTALHLAVINENTGIVRELLKCNDIDVNPVEDVKGYTALHIAVMNGNTGIVRELLNCKDRIRLTEEDYLGRTPIQIAHSMGETDIERALMEKEAVARYVEALYRDRQVYVDAANAILVGAALIGSVTFASWLQPPLGYTLDGHVDVQHNDGLRAFWMFNNLSFYFVIGTVVFVHVVCCRGKIFSSSKLWRGFASIFW